MDVLGEFVAPAMSLFGLIAEQVPDRRSAKRETVRREQERRHLADVTESFAVELLGSPDDPGPRTWGAAVASLKKLVDLEAVDHAELDLQRADRRALMAMTAHHMFGARIT